MEPEEIRDMSDADLAARYVELQNLPRNSDRLSEYMDIGLEILRRWLYEQGVK